jgi:hypothetical protein
MPGLGLGGMLPGFGLGPRSPPGAGRSPRGPPGPGRSPPGRAGRSPPGRGPRGAAGVAAAPPPPTPNGLLPGRGVRGPGLGDCFFGGTTAPPGWPPAGVDLGGCARVGSAGACGGAAAAAAAAGAGTSAATGSGSAGLLGRAGPGLGPGRLPGTALGCCSRTGGAVWAGAGVAGAAGADADAAGLGAGAAPGTGDAGRGLPPDLDRPLPPSCLGNESRNLRATGASTVEDADFTNSPRSFSLASTSLLVTPSSLASSCTRALPATALLI